MRRDLASQRGRDTTVEDAKMEQRGRVKRKKSYKRSKMGDKEKD